MVPIITGIHAKNRQKARESDLEEKKIGILEIPKIDVHLPIYPSVSEQELESGVGHIPESNWIDEGKDFADEEGRLRKSYNRQIEIYSKALEVATGKKVKEAYLYLFAAGKQIKM